jgi:glucose-6-phosphate isomerase
VTDASLSRLRSLSAHAPAVPLLVDVSRTCLPVHAKTSDPLLLEAFPAAFSGMAALEAGAVANPDEGRRVGHYWLRAPELAPEPELTQAIEETIRRVKAFAADVHSGKIAPESASRFRNVLLVGIGGSALGPQLVSDALGSGDDRVRLFFFDNTDPDGMAREMDRIAAAGGIERTLTVVVSKSGGTKETRNGMLLAQAACTAKGLDFGRHAVAVTQDGSDLDKLARRQKWLARFPMWDWVGGRTSQLSAVGLLPAALQGIDVDGLLEGARDCDAATRIPDVGKNPAALLALAWYRETGGRGLKDMVVLPYKDRLLLLSRYLQQLVMESLGKEKDLSGNTVHQGIAVYGNKGSTDQHAFVQQLREGVPNFFVTFIEVLKDRRDGLPSLAVEEDVTSGDYLHGFLLGTREALTEKGRGSVTITVEDVSARSLGALIALFERTVGLYALLVGVNAYHQPGVEAGKKAAAAVLDVQRALLAAMRAETGTFRTAEEWAKTARAGGETAWKVLEHLAANPDHGVQRRPGADPFASTYGTA